MFLKDHGGTSRIPLALLKLFSRKAQQLQGMYQLCIADLRIYTFYKK